MINVGVDVNDNINYELFMGLSWYVGVNFVCVVYGIFIVDVGSIFIVISELDEIMVIFNWNGSKLIK